jgi:DNA-binding GntR family transcriptional regulator
VRTAPSFTDQLVEQIRGDIATGKLQPHSLHTVPSLAADYGVSRTPVREALLLLAKVDMVQFERNRGIRILEPTVHDLEEIFQLRLMLEPPTAYRTAMHPTPALIQQLHHELDAMEKAVADDDEDRFTRFSEYDVRFHEVILEAAGNKRLVHLLRDLRDATRILGASALLKDADKSQSPLAKVMSEHKPVLRAIEERKPEQAARAMYEHVKQTGELLIERRMLETNQGATFHCPWSEGIASPGDRSLANRRA